MALNKVYDYYIPQDYEKFVGVCPNAKYEILGQNTVCAHENGAKTVLKQENPLMAEKNAAVSRIYRFRKIAVPHITACEHSGAEPVDSTIYYEKYDMIPGVSLTDAVKQGIGADDIIRVYDQALLEFIKMRRVQPWMLVDENPYDLNGYNMFRGAIADGIKPFDFVGRNALEMACNINEPDREDVALFHCDITPDNMIVSSDGHFQGLVNLGKACICDRTFAFSAMAASYKDLGFDVGSLRRKYEMLGGQKLNPFSVSTMVGLHSVLSQHTEKVR